MVPKELTNKANDVIESFGHNVKPDAPQQTRKVKKIIGILLVKQVGHQ